MHTAMSVMHAYSGLNEPANHTEGCPQARAEQASPRPQKQERLAGHCCSSLAPKPNPQIEPPKQTPPKAENLRRVHSPLLRKPSELPATLNPNLSDTTCF